jgi:type IV pilus assembly protein PilM
MSQKIIGIDLGTYSLKILYLERRVQELQVLEFIEEPINLQSRVPHEEQSASILEKIFSNRSLDADVICMSMPGHLLSSRVITLPFTNAKRINQLVEFELESYIPFQVEDIFSDFHILQQTATESDVLCVYTLESHLSKYMDSLTASNIEAKYFGADFIDLAGISQMAIVPHYGYYSILDIGHSGSNLLIMEGSELRYARSIGVGGYHFTRAIQRAFNLNFEKAEALKLSRGKLYVREDDSDHVSRILNKTCQELASSVKQTFMGAKNIIEDISISPIYCCGGSSKLVGMLDFLSFHLRTNVFELDSLNFIQHQFDDPEEVNTVIPQVLATTIRPIYSNKIPRINFRKGPFAFTQDLQVITTELKSIAAFVVVMIMLGIGYYFYADVYYSNKISSIDKMIQSVIKTDFKDINIKKGRRLKTYLESAKSKLNELKESTPALQKGDDTVVHILYDISKSLPPKKDVNFEVKEFIFSENNVRMKASTNDTLNADKIVEALQKSNKFSSIQSDDAKPKPGNKWDFNIKIKLTKGINEDDDS